MNRILALLLALAGTPALGGVLPSTVTLPQPDIAAALAADTAAPGTKPFRFAVPIATAISPLTHGQWSTRPDGLAEWRLDITATGAKHVNLGFTRFALPAGSQLFVSAPDGSDLRGPYGPADAVAGQLWTPIVRSATVALRLVVPGAQRAAVGLTLAWVNHGFRGFGAKDEITKSGACEIDVACPDGDDWRDEIRSVARYTVAGALLCTGTLVNNTAGDFTPYFLTASHCLPAHALAPTTVFYWNYETSSCGGNPNGSLDQTQQGAIMLATSADGAVLIGGVVSLSDFALLELLSAPAPEFNVYYSGWDNRDLAPLGVTGIHHPAGDEKRISHDFDQTHVANYLAEPTDGTGTHLRVLRWDRGVTEGGSSGSGIWNSEHRLVGTLSGGYSSCDAQTEPDWYGRMYEHWHTLPTPLTSVSTWLDPAGTGAETLDGADPDGGAAAPVAAQSGSGAIMGGGMSITVLLLGLAAVRRRRRR